MAGRGKPTLPAGLIAVPGDGALSASISGGPRPFRPWPLLA